MDNLKSFRKVQECVSYLDPLEVHSVHDGALEESYCGEVSLDQTLQLKPWRSSEYKKCVMLAVTIYSI